ncbi:Oidioi.mRNA.OKI2018_I69.XSR.g13963.t1.cds [Oikopleura dioica]|uniref:Oidioi.mRNA.OKI2018_I69.XSR.g13963.t1.cds n=1 Tax=Oikopleura dioica TaxID=34765 RepID=A0ABN7S8F6_OIKDI|nr:Oidioi.mRNA.OKI2018_I69.XSR.g13963.t1.cds [Oikopleura dioica]
MGKFAGNWKRVRSEGGAAFFLAFGAPQEKLEKAAKAELTTTVTSDGKNIEIKRTYSLDGESKESVTKVVVGEVSDIVGPFGQSHKVEVKADGEAVVASTTDGAITIRFEIVNDELVETFSGKGNTFKRFHARA